MKALMIGAGGIAHQHLKALKTLGTEIYGIYDLDPAKAAALAAQYGTQAFSEIGDKLQNADVIFLLTPPSTRLAYLRQIAGKCRNVFMEKPLAITVEDALEMEKLEQEYDMNCMVGFTQRFREGYRLLKGLLDRGELGEEMEMISKILCMRSYRLLLCVSGRGRDRTEILRAAGGQIRIMSAV